MGSVSFRIRGKLLTEADLVRIRSLMVQHPDEGRSQLSKRICQSFGWRQPNGQWQDMACREILLQLEKRAVLTLPPRKREGNYRASRLSSLLTFPLEPSGPERKGTLGQFPDVHLRLVSGKESQRWNALIHRHHYLGYQSTVGRSLKYWIEMGDEEVGLLGWGSPAWKVAGRDDFIGWDAATREKNIHGIVNNTRFLIYPWVAIKFLASHVLSLATRRLAQDWQDRYGMTLFLAETFVQKDKFRGTCYKAANWIYVGDTQGRGKWDQHNQHKQPVKSVWLYPLSKLFREKLTA